KPAWHFATADGEGHRIEGEGRQCVHCQFMWEYRPGSGIRRGFCLRCNGWLCGREVCAQLQQRMLAQFAHLSGATDRHCIPYTDWIERLRDRYDRDPRWKVLPSGIIVSNA